MYIYIYLSLSHWSIFIYPSIPQVWERDLVPQALQRWRGRHRFSAHGLEGGQEPPPEHRGSGHCFLLCLSCYCSGPEISGQLWELNPTRYPKNAWLGWLRIILIHPDSLFVCVRVCLCMFVFCFCFFWMILICVDNQFQEASIIFIFPYFSYPSNSVQPICHFKLLFSRTVTPSLFATVSLKHGLLAWRVWWQFLMWNRVSWFQDASGVRHLFLYKMHGCSGCTGAHSFCR
jgi:hypothetical protein